MPDLGNPVRNALFLDFALAGRTGRQYGAEVFHPEWRYVWNFLNQSEEGRAFLDDTPPASDRWVASMREQLREVITAHSRELVANNFIPLSDVGHGLMTQLTRRGGEFSPGLSTPGLSVSGFSTPEQTVQAARSQAVPAAAPSQAPARSAGHTGNAAQRFAANVRPQAQSR